MKKRIIILFAVVTALISMSAIQAAGFDIAQLKMKISSKINGYAFCLGHTCYPLTGVDKSIPMEVGAVDSVIMTDMATMAMYTQPVPASCHLTINNKDTVVVSGKLVAKSGGGVAMENLRCTVKHT
jgi:L-serine deaminase